MLSVGNYFEFLHRNHMKEYEAKSSKKPTVHRSVVSSVSTAVVSCSNVSSRPLFLHKLCLLSTVLNFTVMKRLYIDDLTTSSTSSIVIKRKLTVYYLPHCRFSTSSSLCFSSPELFCLLSITEIFRFYLPSRFSQLAS